eukprot:CAMPEP_0171530468 /NCGR_PEP_ID=MMETSP0959-20130129/13102_1 /TAXON_ID=87120 /ORGANISM="Aurantiochytrium limacinum, Strain ATCCMYA-1381" /LENGTH=56 /DNA_ID=CAMNT_0012073279 /DNA_START=246 /DNA_END=412 /DNA_ORIENTATION=-
MSVNRDGVAARGRSTGSESRRSDTKRAETAVKADVSQRFMAKYARAVSGSMPSTAS